MMQSLPKSSTCKMATLGTRSSAHDFLQDISYSTHTTVVTWPFEDSFFFSHIHTGPHSFTAGGSVGVAMANLKLKAIQNSNCIFWSLFNLLSHIISHMEFTPQIVCFPMWVCVWGKMKGIFQSTWLSSSTDSHLIVNTPLCILPLQRPCGKWDLLV